MTEETLIWSEITVGQVLRSLNRLCVNALKEGDAVKARELAEVSSAVEEAVTVSGVEDDQTD